MLYIVYLFSSVILICSNLAKADQDVASFKWLCANQNCDKPISEFETKSKLPVADHNEKLTYDIKAKGQVLKKPSDDTEFWFVEMDGRQGYVNKNNVREVKILEKGELHKVDGEIPMTNKKQQREEITPSQPTVIDGTTIYDLNERHVTNSVQSNDTDPVSVAQSASADSVDNKVQHVGHIDGNSSLFSSEEPAQSISGGDKKSGTGHKSLPSPLTTDYDDGVDIEGEEDEEEEDEEENESSSVVTENQSGKEQPQQSSTVSDVEGSVSSNQPSPDNDQLNQSSPAQPDETLSATGSSVQHPVNQSIPNTQHDETLSANASPVQHPVNQSIPNTQHDEILSANASSVQHPVANTSRYTINNRSPHVASHLENNAQFNVDERDGNFQNTSSEEDNSTLLNEMDGSKTAGPPSASPPPQFYGQFSSTMSPIQNPSTSNTPTQTNPPPPHEHNLLTSHQHPNTPHPQDTLQSPPRPQDTSQFPPSSPHPGVAPQYTPSSPHPGVAPQYTPSSPHPGEAPKYPPSSPHPGVAPQYTPSSPHTPADDQSNSSQHTTGNISTLDETSKQATTAQLETVKDTTKSKDETKEPTEVKDEAKEPSVTDGKTSKEGTITEDDTSKEATVTEDETNKKPIVGEDETSKEATLTGHETNKEPIVGKDETSKEATLTEDETNKEAIVEEDKTSKEATLTEDETNKEAIVEEDETSKEVIVEEDETSKEATVTENETSEEVIVREDETIKEDIVGSVITEDVFEKSYKEREDTTGFYSSVTSMFGSLWLMFDRSPLAPSAQSPERQPVPSSDSSSTAPVGYCYEGEMCRGLESPIGGEDQPSYWTQPNVDLLKNSTPLSLNSIIYIGISSLVILIFSLGYYYIDKSQSSWALVAKVNDLSQELFVTKKERDTLEEQLLKIKENCNMMDSSKMKQGSKLSSLETALEQSERVKAELEESLVIMEKENEMLMEKGLEMHKLLSETISEEERSQILLANIDELKQSLSEKLEQIVTLTNHLDQKNQEMQLMQIDVGNSHERVKELEKKLESSKAETEDLFSKKLQDQQQQIIKLQKLVEEKGMVVAKLESELAKTKVERDSADARASSAEAGLQAAHSVGVGEARESWLDSTSVRAALALAHKQNQTLQLNITDITANNKALQDKLEKLSGELLKLNVKYEDVEREKVNALTKLQVLSDYFKEKETKLQEELGVKESQWLQKESEDHTIYEQMKSLRDEISSYKAQNEKLKAEILEQEGSYKVQIANEEQKSYDNWVALRQAERKIKELQMESAHFRNRLTQIETANTHNISEPLNPNGLDKVIGASPTFMMMPPLPQSDFFPLPPPPLHPSASRPPPLGRISSPQLSGEMIPPPPLVGYEMYPPPPSSTPPPLFPLYNPQPRDRPLPPPKDSPASNYSSESVNDKGGRRRRR